jgi:hypothetical protein
LSYTKTKYLEIMKSLTVEYAKRAEKSLEETKNFLAKEMKISEDLRHNDNIEFYKSHILKLETILKTKQW